jgi:hypothetical protein
MRDGMSRKQPMHHATNRQKKQKKSRIGLRRGRRVLLPHRPIFRRLYALYERVAALRRVVLEVQFRREVVSILMEWLRPVPAQIHRGPNEEAPRLHECNPPESLSAVDGVNPDEDDGRDNGGDIDQEANPRRSN